ncbi:hypothetical protein AB0L59_28555 [Streptomyces sp. NPDC052109]|uniref:tetratricopeptide repeat protein n=1 Tax=Streptomyces sp. NPDC052109 TaxID=3155527 RepID=UPI00343C9644
MQELETAAGCTPRSVTRPRSRAIRQANELCRSRGLPFLVGKTVSDWIRLGRAAEDFEQLWCLVATLLTWSRDSDGAGFPAERSTRRYWKQLWEDARSASTPAGEQGVARLGSPVGCLDPVRALEVHPAIEINGSHSESPLPLYIPREHDRRLCEETSHALRGSRSVILVADSSTGKTRALWEAVRQLPDGWLVWRPPDRPALLDGLADGRPLRRTVVWLNETQRYLYSPHSPAEGEKTAAALTGLLLDPERGPVLVVGTLWRDGHALLSTRPTSQQALDPHAHARSVLAAATVIEVPEQFDSAALADVRRRAGEDPRLADALRYGGVRVTQYLAGARELLNRYDHAPPEARALLDAAADARRLGHSEALPRSFIEPAAAAYLDPDHWRTQSDDWRATWFRRAVAYTGQPCRGVPGPLQAHVPLPGQANDAGDTYRLADYLRSHTARTRRFIVPPAGFWQAAAEHLHRPEDLAALAKAAQHRHRLHIADSLYRAAVNAGDISSLKQLTLMRHYSPDREGSRRIALQAARDGHFEPLSYLAGNLAVQGAPEEAMKLYRTAVEMGHSVSLLPLAPLVETSGQLEEAEELYRAAVEAGYTDSLLDLARLREAAGDIAEADGLRSAAVKAGNMDVMDLAGMWERRGQPHRAEWLYLEAVEAGYSRYLLDAARLRKDAGDQEGAERFYRSAADAGYFVALTHIAKMRQEAGDEAGAARLAGQAAQAERRYRQDLAEGRHSTPVTHGQHLDTLIGLAQLREQAGDLEGAGQFLVQTAVTGFFEPLMDFARRLEQSGDGERAEALYQAAADAGRPDLLACAAVQRERAGDEPTAERLALQCAKTGGTNGLCQVGRDRRERGNRAGAEWAFRAAANAGNVPALMDLAQLRKEAGDPEGAEQLHHEAAAAGYVPALMLLAAQREGEGNDNEAERYYREAAALRATAGPGTGSNDALRPLAHLRERTGDQEGAEQAAEQADHAARTELFLGLAKARMDRGDTDGVNRILARALDSPGTALLLALAQLHQDSGDQDGAERIAMRVLDAGHSEFLRFRRPVETERWAHIRRYGLNAEGGPADPWF